MSAWLRPNRIMAACPACGTPFTCSLRETGSPCWCASLPPLKSVAPGMDCLCPSCLRERLAAERAAWNDGEADDAAR